jgi:glycosyltransferase involved in cell wall biosynthesis
MAELKQIELEVFLRQCLISTGHGRTLYVGDRTTDALRFLLQAGVDAYALLPSEEAAMRAAPAFAGARAGWVSAGRGLADAFPGIRFDALIVVDELACEPEEGGAVVDQIVGERFPQVCVLARQGHEGAGQSSPSSYVVDRFSAAYRRHPRARTAIFHSPLPPASELVSWFLEALPDAALAVDALPADILRGDYAGAVAALSGVTELCEYVRIGDVVGVLDVHGGSTARIVEHNSAASEVLAFVPDEPALRYASANYAPDGHLVLRTFADAMSSSAPLDVVVATECEPVPAALLQALIERVRPGGRVILGVSGELFAADEGESPLTARTWLCEVAGTAAERFIAERAYRGDVVSAQHGARTWRGVGIDEWLQAATGGLLIVAMADPLAATSTPYVETTFETVDSKDFAVVPGAGDMEYPWLFKSMISIGMRLTNAEALAQLNERVLASTPPASADFGAALCGQAYRLLAAGPSSAEAQACIERIEQYLGSVGATPQQLRWSVSLAFVAARLAQCTGDLAGCEHWAMRCASMDPMLFSPLLGTKIVGALDIAATIALLRGDRTAARERLRCAVGTVRRLLSGDWINILGSEDKPLSFGLPEVAQLAEAGARCAYLLNNLDDSTIRAGLVWWEHRGYYERILDAGLRRSESLEAYASSLLRDRMRLEDVIIEKNGELLRLEGVIVEKEAERARLERGLGEKEAQRLRVEGVVTEKEAERLRLEGAIAEKEAERLRLEGVIGEKEAERLRLEGVIAEKEAERLRLEGILKDQETIQARLEALIATTEAARGELEGTLALKELELLRLDEALSARERLRAELEMLLAADRATTRVLEALVSQAKDKQAAEREKRWNLKRLWNALSGRLKRPDNPKPLQSPAVAAPARVVEVAGRKPVGPVLFDNVANRWLGQFRDARVPAQAGLKLVAARDLHALRATEGERVAAIFGATDDIYAMRAHVYDKVDLCIATDSQTYDRLALLHPLVVQAQPADAVEVAQRFNAAMERDSRLHVDEPIKTVSGAPVIMLQVDNFMVGGLERVVFDLLHHLAARGWRPLLGVTGEIAPEAEAELKERQLAYMRLPLEPQALRAALRESQVALVNAHYSLSLAQACSDLGIAFIQTVHNMYMWLDEPSKEKWRTADETTDGYICVSANVAMFADVNLRLARDRMLVIPNGCDAASGVPLAPPESDEALRRELGIPSGSPVFVNVASINPVKGQGLLIDAFALAHAQRPDIRLVILGKHADTAYAERLREKIAGYGLQEKVLMPGYRGDVHRFVDLARAIVMPSFTEGWSLAISEAVQRHAPVIATDVGGAHEQLVDPASTVIRAWRDDWTTLDGPAFYHAIANEDEFHAVRDELAKVLVEHADRQPRTARSELRQSFTSMTPAQAYERHVEVFAAVLARRSATPVRYASYRPQRQSRYFDLGRRDADSR